MHRLVVATSLAAVFIVGVAGDYSGRRDRRPDFSPVHIPTLASPNSPTPDLPTPEPASQPPDDRHRRPGDLDARLVREPESRTPHMDRLAAEGCALPTSSRRHPCAPRAGRPFSRAVWHAGRHHRLDHRTKPRPASACRPRRPPGRGVATGRVRTGLVGKWHLGPLPRLPPDPARLRALLRLPGRRHQADEPAVERRSGIEEYSQGRSPTAHRGRARFIAQEPGRPFALSLHFRAPHAPYGPVPEQDLAPFRDATVASPSSRPRPGTGAPVDARVLREHPFDRSQRRPTARHVAADRPRQTTIVIFTSDHGYNIGHHGLHTKGNGTWIVGGVNGPTMPNMFDTSLRPPFLVRGPGVAGAARVVSEMVSFEDIYPHRAVPGRCADARRRATARARPGTVAARRGHAAVA